MTGKILKINSSVSAFDEIGNWFELSPGDSALVLDENDYDVTVLSYGAVLYISAESLEKNVARS